MPKVLAQVTIPQTGRPVEDSVQNAWVLGLADGFNFSTSLLEATNPISDFYNALGALLSPGVDRTANACRVKFYDLTGHLDGSNHGSPVAEDTFTILTAAQVGSLAYPTQVASVLTLRAENYAAQPVERPDGADAGSLPDRPRSRYTGRLYIGPWGTFAASGGHPSRPGANLVTAVLNAFEATQDEYIASGHQGVNVWSRTDGVARPVTRVEVDDSWDIQRRRKVDPTTRTARTI